MRLSWGGGLSADHGEFCYALPFWLKSPVSHRGQPVARHHSFVFFASVAAPLLL